jgi:trimethylamine--corrinoid protein Co-methyltransferase
MGVSQGSMSQPRGRSGRRSARAESPLRAFPFQLLRNPLPPLALCSEAQIERLHQASMHILENIGLEFWDEEALDIWAAARAKVDRGAQRVWPDRGLILEAVSRAPASFIWRARNPDRNVIIGGDSITFAPNSGMPYVTDYGRGRRPSTLSDLEDFLKLAQSCQVLHFAGSELVAPQDVPPSLRHLRRMTAATTLTDKAVRDVAHGRVIPADNIQMARIAFGGELPDDPVIGGVVNVNSPLRYDARMLGGLITYARAGQITIITPFIMAGAMSPITLAAALAQQNAEALAGIALAQLVRPGAPVLYGGFTTNVDMRSGSPMFGTPEGAQALLIGAQLARRYNLPYRGSGSLNTSKVPDAQAAFQSMWTIWPAILGHTNFVHHAVGWLESGLTASLEKFIIDAEGLAMFYHFLREVPMSDEDLALDMIAAVGPGGHHFGTPHTQARYKTAFFQPFVSDQLSYEAWIEQGGQDSAQRAHKLWQELLAEFEAPPLDSGIAEGLQDFAARRERELEGVDLYA